MAGLLNRLRYPLSLLAWAAVATAPLWQTAAQNTTPLTRYPYLQDMRTDRVTVVWVTPDLAEGTLEYSLDRSVWQGTRAQVSEIPARVTELGIPYYKYQAFLTGLRPGTEYFYRVFLDGGALESDDFRFRTAPVAPESFTFLAFGDSGNGSNEQRQLAQVMFREQPSFVIHTGDIAYFDGSFGTFRNNHFAVYSPLLRRSTFFLCPGNHEYDTPGALPYVLLHSHPAEGVPEPDRGRYYSFDWGNVHFVSLDTNAPFYEAVGGRGQMIRWLEDDLRRTRKLWRVVFFHHPVRPTSNHERDATSALVREHLEPIFDRHDVQLILSGHEHNYQEAAPRRGGQFVGPGQGTVNIITGGGGAGLYTVSPREGLVFAASAHHYLRCEVTGPQFSCRAIDINEQQIDEFTLTTPPILIAAGVVNAASFTTALAPGSLVSIFGRMLATEEGGVNRLPLPTEMGGTTVTFNGRQVPLLFVSRTQINAQLPYDVQGPGTLRVSYAGGSVEVPVTVSEAAPAIFGAGPQRAAVIHANGRLVTDAEPARPGEVVSVFLTGLGRPDGDISAGLPAPASPLISARGPIEAVIGSTSVTPSYAGLTPGFAGLYQANIQVPATLAEGSYGLRVVARGVSSNTVNLAVRR